MLLGIGIGPLYITVFFLYHLYLLLVTSILDLVTHCCVCLVFCGWDGWGKDGWVGFCFLPFGYGVGDNFLFKHLFYFILFYFITSSLAWGYPISDNTVFHGCPGVKQNTSKS